MELATRINDFNHYYHMTSDQKNWRKWNAEEKAINKEIEGLSSDDAKSILALLTDKTTEFVKAVAALIKEEVSIHSKVMKSAWAYIKSGKVANLSDALKRAWKLLKGFADIAGHRLTFGYRKSCGTPRTAVGTISSVSISKAGATVVTYFDELKQGYRSFHLDRLLTNLSL